MKLCPVVFTSRRVEIKSNMRCIETNDTARTPLGAFEIKSNMRCIETCYSIPCTCLHVPIKSNMRCIETLEIVANLHGLLDKE